MITICVDCQNYYDDEFRTTYCPHNTFPANDGHNHFERHHDAYLSRVPPHGVEVVTVTREAAMWERLAKATPGPWWAEEKLVAARIPSGRPNGEIIASFSPWHPGSHPEVDSKANAELAARAPSDLAWLLTELRTLRDQNRELRQAVEQGRHFLMDADGRVEPIQVVHEWDERVRALLAQ